MLEGWYIDQPRHGKHYNLRLNSRSYMLAPFERDSTSVSTNTFHSTPCCLLWRHGKVCPYRYPKERWSRVAMGHLSRRVAIHRALQLYHRAVSETGTGGDSKHAKYSVNCVDPSMVGPQDRIEQNLAYVEMRLVLNRRIQDFEVYLCDNSKGCLESRPSYGLWDKPGPNVNLKPVESRKGCCSCFCSNVPVC